MTLTPEPDTSRSSSGLWFGIAAYLFWGLFPLYWPLLEPASALEILAHRVIWTLVVVLIAITVMRSWQRFVAILRNRRLVALLAVAAVAISMNWGGFIYGVETHQVLQISLGYFINPLVTVLVGVLVLKERLRPAQWIAVLTGFVAVVVLTVDYGKLPWISLMLAFSFAAYGYIKKRTNLGTFDSLGVETLILTPFALGYLAFLQATGGLTFGHQGPGNAALLITTGIVTAVPLLLFGAAATRLSLSTIGILQYLAPILHFILGLTYFNEQMSQARWIGFTLVWTALVIFTADGVANRQRVMRRAAEQSAC